MAPPSRPALTLKAAKKLEADAEALLGLEPLIEATLAASKVNAVFTDLQAIADILSGVKEMCDVGKGTYPSHPAIRDIMLKAGNQIFSAKQDVLALKERCIATAIDDISGWQQIGLELADIASRLRAVEFVPPRKSKKEPTDA
jgi:hypothetical protein